MGDKNIKHLLIGSVIKVNINYLLQFETKIFGK